MRAKPQFRAGNSSRIAFDGVCAVLLITTGWWVGCPKALAAHWPVPAPYAVHPSGASLGPGPGLGGCSDGLLGCGTKDVPISGCHSMDDRMCLLFLTVLWEGLRWHCLEKLRISIAVLASVFHQHTNPTGLACLQSSIMFLLYELLFMLLLLYIIWQEPPVKHTVLCFSHIWPLVSASNFLVHIYISDYICRAVSCITGYTNIQPEKSSFLSQDTLAVGCLQSSVHNLYSSCKHLNVSNTDRCAVTTAQ